MISRQTTDSENHKTWLHTDGTRSVKTWKDRESRYYYNVLYVNNGETWCRQEKTKTLAGAFRQAARMLVF